ncbi:MAG: hydroxyacid dehydrogenase [Candidatus Omnitrophica bacterium]|nr:hydroxyacid dehydrogenase [Candidatus Omnitrophota bacterium]
MKAVFFETAPWERRYLKRALAQQRLRVQLTAEPLTEETLPRAAGAEIVSLFIYSKLTSSLIRRLPRLRFVATRSTGFDHIELAACRTRHITVSNVPSYGENTVAEHTFALILALSRNIHKAYVKTIKGDFSLKGLQGFDVKGRTIGIIGGGHIGLHVIKIAKGFGMNVLVCDVRKNVFLSEVLDFSYVPLNVLLRRSDGAGLDVLEGEELVKEERQLLSQDFSKEKLATVLKNHILLHRENVVITPHIAFDSREALQRILGTTVSSITSWLSGAPINLVSGVLKR